jgi:putative hemolysin
MADLAVPLAGLIVLLALSGFFSGSETALMAVNRYRLGYLERRGDERAAAVRRLIRSPERLISSILLGNNFVNTAASALATTIAIGIAGRNGVVVATFVMTVLILIFSEVAPKTLAARFPERMAFRIARPIGLVVRVLHPIAWAAVHAANLLLLPFGRPHADDGKVSEEDIKGLIELGEEERVIAREKRRMLHGIFRLTETTIEDIMIPRTEINAVSVDAGPSQVIEAIRASGATRLPVFDGSLDRVVGVLHSKDVIRYWGRLREMSLRSLMRRPLFVPETATLEQVLQMFQRERQHLAIVIDEFDGVEGIISLEDLLEEIVGDIVDEHDAPDSPPVVEIEAGTLVASGTCPLSLLRRRYGLELRSRDNSTLAGFVLEVTGRIPGAGERIEHPSATFVIEAATPRRIERVRIRRRAAEDDA